MCEISIETVIEVISVIVAVSAAIFAFWQVKVAKRTIRQAAMMRLFSTFEVANQAVLNKPDLLYSIHGLERSIPQEEAANIAYLSFLLDGFQHFYQEEYSGDFAKMTEKLKQTSNFLNRILRVPENQVRWNQMKTLYYGDFDKSFMDAIDELILFKRSKQAPADIKQGLG